MRKLFKFVKWKFILPIVAIFTIFFACGFKQKKKVVYVDNKVDMEVAPDPIKAQFKDMVATPYQVTMWHLKTAESFRAKPYPDGQYNSIAFGYNFVHGRVPNQTWASGTVLLCTMVEKIQANIRSQKRFRHLDDWQIAALSCRFYNRGTGSLPKFDPEYLLGCCAKDQKGCTSCQFVCTDKKLKPNERAAYTKSVRKSHNARRKFEYNLYYKRFDLIDIKTSKIFKIREKKLKIFFFSKLNN